ncbi:MAG: class I SAM-dependent methyltransferase [Firmicutes bacterium]|nr:class I SAM-dependent methyltransferase [Bacillota bacterium]
MKNNLILETAHQLLSNYITSHDIMVDATMGNGYDTVFLAKQTEFVYAFDIQEKALFETQKQLDEQKIKNVKLILDSHENILNYVNDFKGVIFNLGYLPHGDKSITTKKDSTIRALKSILPVLKRGGFIMIVVYPGHEEGMNESNTLDTYCKTIDQNQYKIMSIRLPYQDNKPPYILFIHKVKDESN